MGYFVFIEYIFYFWYETFIVDYYTHTRARGRSTRNISTLNTCWSHAKPKNPLYQIQTIVCENQANLSILGQYIVICHDIYLMYLMYQKRYIEKKSAFGRYIILIVKRNTTLYRFILHCKFLSCVYYLLPFDYKVFNDGKWLNILFVEFFIKLLHTLY